MRIEMRMLLSSALAASVAPLTLGTAAPTMFSEPQGGALAGERPRVIVSSDIGGSDNDDYQSMVHLLLYADVLDIEGLLSSPPGAGRTSSIQEVLDAYAQDYKALSRNAPSCPEPEALRRLVKQGATDSSPEAGYSQPTEGSSWLIERSNAPENRRLYVLVWGAITDVAQAVHDDPSIKAKLRVYSIGSWNTGQDQAARDYLYHHHPDLWWIEADTTFRGMYTGGVNTGDLGNKTFLDRHVRRHGALGDFLAAKLDRLKMGDTPSVLYLLRGDPADPTGPHWGGSFAATGHGSHYWTDRTDPALAEGPYPGAKTVNVWREAFLRDWQARMDRAQADASACNAELVNANGWFTHEGKVIWGWVQHNGWWRPGQRPNIPRRSAGDPGGDVRPNRTEDLDALTDSMLSYGYPGFEHNFGLWYDRRRDAHDIVERTTPDAKPPFLEQPWARSNEGMAADGLPKYDLTRFNPWYFKRVKAFADLCDAKGTVLFHKFYMQHALLENQAHYVDFPWRPGNCVQNTEMPDQIPAANAFYDVANTTRCELHRLYIRKCLDVLGGNANVVHLTSQEFTGPVGFVQFWIDTIAEWERETDKEVCIGLGAPKNVQDAVLSDPARGARVRVMDLRYWWIKSDGEIYAPEGGRGTPGRDFECGTRQAAETSPERIYQKVRTYRDQYPGKAIIDAVSADRKRSWAFLMAGGGMLVRGQISYPNFEDPVNYIQPADVEIILPTYSFIRRYLAHALPMMRPADIVEAPSHPAWCLADTGKTYLVYAPAGGTFTLDLANAEGAFAAAWFDPRNGELHKLGNGPVMGGQKVSFTTPDEQDWALWLEAGNVET